MNTFISDISNKEFPVTEKVSARIIRPSLLAIIQKDKPAFTEENYLSVDELNYYRQKYISDTLVSEMGELTELEQTVLTSLTDKTTITDKVDVDKQQNTTFGQRVADKVASFGGSWKFIIMFGTFIFVWISLNVFMLANKGFDPYPYILLNLILSCIAAIQAPVIMMSQNRQEDKDRERAKKDYMINLKSELEIRMLHEKIDHLIMHQQQELLEIQKVQIEMMKDILEKVERKP
ncbi:MAG: DUF1003 domain-containing protein [Bacteroidota bacterium]